MARYKAYPTSKDTPNRKTRKSQRRSTFAFNKAQAEVERKERREKRSKV